MRAELRVSGWNHFGGMEDRGVDGMLEWEMELRYELKRRGRRGVMK